jgi:hypothetical protein
MLVNKKLYTRERALFGVSSEKLVPVEELQYRLFKEAEI